MGFYIEVPHHFGKVEQIVEHYGGIILDQQPKSFSDVPQGKGLICVVRNNFFEAAGFCYDENEFKDFTRADDYRPKKFVLMDWDRASELSGHKRVMKIRED